MFALCEIEAIVMIMGLPPQHLASDQHWTPQSPGCSRPAQHRLPMRHARAQVLA